MKYKQLTLKKRYHDQRESTLALFLFIWKEVGHKKPYVEKRLEYIPRL